MALYLFNIENILVSVNIYSIFVTESQNEISEN